MKLPDHFRAACVVGLLFLQSGPPSVLAQIPPSAETKSGAKWGVVDGLGYGALGFGGGVGITWGMEAEDFGPPAEALLIIGATTLAGAVLGAVVGNTAQRTIADGRTIDGLHRAAVVSGAVLAGAAVGALTAAALINGDGEGTFIGTDEKTFALLTGGGSVLGVAFVWAHRSELRIRNVQVRPDATRNAGLGFKLVAPF